MNSLRNKTSVIFGSDWAPIRHFGEVIDANALSVYGDLQQELTSANYRIFNLESPLYPCDYITKSGAAFSGKPESISALTAIHCDAVVMANNHTFDCGEEGFRKTRELLHAHGIATVGAGENLEEARQPHVFNIGECRVGLFTLSEGEDCRGATLTTPGVRPWEVEELCSQISRYRSQLDIILVSVHCGLEYQAFPSFYVWECFEKIALAGADVIIGHHPHVPQGMHTFGQCQAFFSLGNFVFYQPNRLKYRKTGYMLKMSILDRKLEKIDLIPYRIEDDALRLLNDQEKEAFFSDMAEVSKPLENRDSALQAWNAVLAEYGVPGFCEELARISKTMSDSPKKGAAMLRNRLRCIQHYSQWLDGMERIIHGKIDDVPEEYRGWVHRYMTEELPS